MADRSQAARRAGSPAKRPAHKEERLQSVQGLARDPEKLDRLVHERVRLGLLSALAVTDSLSFTELKRLLHASDGNLSVHARKLEEAEYIECTKSFEKRLPKTEYRLTPHGRRALKRYLDHMEALIEATRGS